MIVGPVDMNDNDFQLISNVDFNPNIQVKSIKDWVNYILNLPINPLLTHTAPQFVDDSKIKQLLNEMVPSKSICNVDRSYSAIVEKSTIPNYENPPLTVKIKLNPILIKGGGPKKMA